MNSHYSNEENDLSNTNTKSFGELFYFVVFIKNSSADNHAYSSQWLFNTYYLIARVCFFFSESLI